jgi:hypothetical protein
MYSVFRRQRASRWRGYSSRLMGLSERSSGSIHIQAATAAAAVPVYASSDSAANNGGAYVLASLLAGAVLATSNDITKAQCDSPNRKPTLNTPAPPAFGSNKVYTRKEIAKHNSAETRVWVTYGDGQW